MWCDDTTLTVNHDKSKIVHFKPKSVQQTQNIFRVRVIAIVIETQYTYLCLLLTEDLDYNNMAMHVAKDVNRH